MHVSLHKTRSSRSQLKHELGALNSTLGRKMIFLLIHQKETTSTSMGNSDYWRHVEMLSIEDFIPRLRESNFRIAMDTHTLARDVNRRL